MKRIAIVVVLIFSLNFISIAQTAADTTNIEWKEGYLDIHHILTGSGDCAFIVMPDGTTMIVDAGDIGDRQFRKSGYPLKSTNQYPDNSITPAQRIIQYIKQILPKKEYSIIDYALLTHYHDDHIGGITPNTKLAHHGEYKLTGITELGDSLKIKNLIDRNYPNYNYPTDLKIAYQNEPSIFLNLLKFIHYQQTKNGMVAAQLIPGSTSQVQMVNKKSSYQNFSIRGVKANGTIWTGNGNETKTYFTADSVLNNGKFNENPLSLAVKISYGNFDYFTGGDNTGLQGFGMPQWFDVETPMAKAVGNVEVTTLCHHGCRDAVNDNFLHYLNPQTIVHQTWSSNHPGEEVLHRMIYKEIKNVFATNILDETKTTLGFWLTNTYKSIFGHIIVRVLPGGNKYYVLIAETMNDKVQIKKVFGPYTSK
jgi:beta-lactamase superfamily II metal-dependent hydrolase